MHMSQQTVNSNTDPYSNAQTSSTESLSLIEAIGQLPRQYIKVLCRPSAQTFREEMGKASWVLDTWLERRKSYTHCSDYPYVLRRTGSDYAYRRASSTDLAREN
jgi:hypothetical protein